MKRSNNDGSGIKSNEESKEKQANLPTDGNGVKLWHKIRSIRENVLDNSHTVSWRINVGVSNHVFLFDHEKDIRKQMERERREREFTFKISF